MIELLSVLLTLTPVPEGTGRILDQAGVISPSDEITIQAAIDDLERSAGGELVVLTIKSLRPESPKEYATKVFNSLGIGKAGADNGVLLLVVTGDRRVEIETGYGTEATLTDGRSGAILDKHVIPKFKAGDYSGGIRGGAVAISRLLQGDAEFIALLDDAVDAKNPSSWRMPHPGWWLFAAMFIVMIITVALRGGRHTDWTKWLMWTAIFPFGVAALFNMVSFSLPAVLVHLIVVPIWIWLAFKFKISLRKCPTCSKRSITRTRTTLQSASYSSGGSDRITARCSECNYKRSRVVSTARLTQSSSSTSSSYSSASSSSSSSSSSSYGGGSSGGGGAGRSW